MTRLPVLYSPLTHEKKNVTAFVYHDSQVENAMNELADTREVQDSDLFMRSLRIKKLPYLFIIIFKWKTHGRYYKDPNYLYSINS